MVILASALHLVNRLLLEILLHSGLIETDSALLLLYDLSPDYIRLVTIACILIIVRTSPRSVDILYHCLRDPKEKNFNYKGNITDLHLLVCQGWS